MHFYFMTDTYNDGKCNGILENLSFSQQMINDIIEKYAKYGTKSKIFATIKRF